MVVAVAAVGEAGVVQSKAVVVFAVAVFVAVGTALGASAMTIRLAWNVGPCWAIGRDGNLDGRVLLFLFLFFLSPVPAPPGSARLPTDTALLSRRVFTRSVRQQCLGNQTTDYSLSNLNSSVQPKIE